MACCARTLPLDIVIHSLAGDATVLCAVVRAGGRASIVINDRYPDALDHARAHLEQSDTSVWICSPDCPGA